MKMSKFKNVVEAHNLDGLIKVFCDHEKHGSEYYHEYFFLNNDFEVKAHFASTGVMRVRQLCKQNETLFRIIESSPDNNWERKKLIVRVNPDLSYEILHEVDDYGMGVMDGLIPIKKNGLWGFIDDNGEEFIKPQYDDYCDFKNSYACVKKGEKWGFINKNNEIIIPFEYDMQEYCTNGDNPAVCLHGYSYFANHNGKLLATVAKGEKWGVIDLNNNVVLPFKYDWLLLGTGKYIGAKLNHKWGFIDINDNVIVPFIYDAIYKVENELHYYTAVKDKLMGLFSFDKGMIIPCEYKTLHTHHNTICAQKQNCKYVFLSYDNKEHPKEYSYIESCPNQGLFHASKNNKHYGYINEQGEVVVPFKYSHSLLLSLLGFWGGLTIAKYYDYKKGSDVINTKGEILYHAKMCNDVFNIGNGYILAENDNSEFEFIKLI